MNLQSCLDIFPEKVQLNKKSLNFMFSREKMDI